RQTTINQRFEVCSPKNRPFFLENANYFQAPITLFFSRRVRDPQLGARVTGRAGRWAIGALAMDDRQRGRAVAAYDPLAIDGRRPVRSVAATDSAAGDRTFNGLFRARRDFANQSRVGFMLT